MLTEALNASYMYQVLNIIFSQVSMFVATILKDISKFSIFLFQNISFNFAFILSHPISQLFNFKSIRLKKLILLITFSISMLCNFIAMQAAIIALILVHETSSG